VGQLRQPPTSEPTYQGWLWYLCPYPAATCQLILSMYMYVVSAHDWVWSSHTRSALVPGFLRKLTLPWHTPCPIVSLGTQARRYSMLLYSPPTDWLRTRHQATLEDLPGQPSPHRLSVSGSLLPGGRCHSCLCWASVT